MLMLISMHFCVFVLNLTFDMRYILFSLLSFYVCTNKDKCRTCMQLGDQSKSWSVLIYCLFNTQCLSLFVGVGRYFTIIKRNCMFIILFKTFLYNFFLVKSILYISMTNQIYVCLNTSLAIRYNFYRL